MSSNYRKILFSVFFSIFVLAAPSMILYSQGYRLDFSPANGKIIVKTGGLFIKIYPKSAEIFINGKFAKKTDIFFGSALIENLTPKKYKIEVKKEGYYSWEKSLDVKEKEVTELKNIVLFPKNPQFEVLGKDINDFWVSPDGKKIILYEDHPGGWTLKLYDVEKNLKSQMIGEDDIYADGASLNGLKWFWDSKSVELDVDVKNEKKYYQLNIEKFPPRLSKTDTPPVPGNTLAYEKTDDAVYYLDSQGFVFRKDLSNGFAVKVNSKPLTPLQDKIHGIRILNGNIFLKDGSTLYFFSEKSGEFEKIHEDVSSDPKISPDGQKIAFFSNSELWVFFLKEKTEEIKKNPGDKLFIARISEKIQDCYWFNSDYLVFSAGGSIKAADIDERDKINITDLAKFSDLGKDQSRQKQAMAWDGGNRILFVLANGSLFKSQID